MHPFSRTSPVLSTSLVLTEDDFSPAELSAARLDGDVFAVDRGFASVAEPESSELRAAALGSRVPAGTVAELQTALWIYGIAPSPPFPHQLCVNAHGPLRGSRVSDLRIREVSLGENDVREVAGLRVTTPSRTLFDVARTDDDFDPSVAAQLAELARRFVLTPGDLQHYVDAAAYLPHKKRAARRLRAVFALDLASFDSVGIGWNAG